MATKSVLLAEITTNFPDNTAGLITPAIQRTTHTDEINSWQQAPGINSQLGTTYTVLSSDYGQVILLNNTSPVAVSLPTPATTGFNPFNTFFKNNGTGLVTITPVSPATIDGVASLALGSGQSVYVISDGTNWRTAVIAGAPQLLSVNSTAISGGTSGNFFYNNAGTFGERNSTQATAALNTFTSTLQGLTPPSGGGTTNFLRADGAWAVPSTTGAASLIVGSSTVTTGTSGRVLFDNVGILGEYPISGTGNVAMTTSPAFVTPALGTPSSGTLTNCTGLPTSGLSGQVTLAQLPTIGANTVLGSIAGGTPIALTTAQHTTLVNVFTPTLSGAAPASGGGTTTFLRADGTWSIVSGAVSSVTNSDGTLTISPTTGAVVASLALGHANTWTAAQTFNSSFLKLGGSSSGSTTLNASPTASGTITLPAVTDTVAVLGTADQTVSGGANITSKSLTAGNITIDCGVCPLQFITNNAAFTITAPVNDGSCMVLITNGASAGTVTFSGFSVGSNTGDALTTTNTNKFTVSIWRINGTSGYRIAAHQ